MKIETEGGNIAMNRWMLRRIEKEKKKRERGKYFN
jgi:hypothetical protein